MPVVVIAIAALPAVALLLAVVARMESAFFVGGYLDDAALRDRYLGDALAASPDTVPMDLPVERVPA